MKLLFTVFDKKSGHYVVPFVSDSHGTAERDFRTAINNPDSGNLNKYPEDFALYYYGIFDETTGAVDVNLTLMAEATNFV